MIPTLTWAHFRGSSKSGENVPGTLGIVPLCARTMMAASSLRWTVVFVRRPMFLLKPTAASKCAARASSTRLVASSSTAAWKTCHDSTRPSFWAARRLFDVAISSHSSCPRRPRNDHRRHCRSPPLLPSQPSIRRHVIAVVTAAIAATRCSRHCRRIATDSHLLLDHYDDQGSGHLRLRLFEPYSSCHIRSNGVWPS